MNKRAMLKVCATTLCILFAAASTPAVSADYPAKPITLIVPFPAGGATDAAGRLLGSVLSDQLGQSIVVENVSGASGSIAAQKAIRAQPDGYTLHFGTINDVSMFPMVNKDANYASTDLQPIGQTFSTTALLVGHPSVPADTMDELVAYLKEKPNSLSMGHPGIGTVQHMTAALIAEQAKVDWTYIPYRGAAPLMTDLLGGHIDLAIVSMPSGLPNLIVGKIKTFGVIRDERDPSHPDIPTVNESTSLTGLDADQWIGVFVPKETPTDIVETLSSALRAAIRQPEFKSAQLRLGANTPDDTSPEQFATHIRKMELIYRPIAETLKLD